MEDEIVKMRLELGPDDYQKAGEAHLKGLYVSVRGILRRGARIHRLERATDFAVIGGPMSAAVTESVVVESFEPAVPWPHGRR